MMDWQTKYRDKELSLAEAVRRIPRGKHVFIGSGAAEPVGLVGELVAQASRFCDNTIVHLLTLGPAPYVAPEHAASFRHNAFFIGPNTRDAVANGRADYTPVFLSRIPGLIRSRRMPVDVALIEVSPPDHHGFVNLGISVDVVLAAVEAASLVIAEINPRMPVVFGDGFIPMDRIDAWVVNDRPLLTVEPEPLDEVALEIGRQVASLVDDGATIQVGIGQIPDATLRALASKRDLGVWTEMFSDGVVDLVQAGAVTGRFKTIEPGRVSSSFTFGTQRVYDYIHQNPAFVFHPSDYINDPVRVSRQHDMVAINSALAVDLTGQVCADSIGGRFYSGIGGQVDFIRGASMCPGGKPIIALRSTAKSGSLSRVAAVLEPGSGVVTSRGDVRYVVTEYGVADLLGKSVRERAMALIGIAHPQFRGELLAAAKARRYVFPDQVAQRSTYPRDVGGRIASDDGRALDLRPVRVTDATKMQQLFYALSEDTIFKRYMHARKRMTHSDLIDLVDVDYAHDMVLVVETVQEESETEIIAVGRYHTDPATGYADIAFLVRDDWQGQGIGTALLRQLTQVARAHGIGGFTAEVLATNLPMMHVFHKSGLELRSTLSDGVYTIVMSFTPQTSTLPLSVRAPALSPLAPRGGSGGVKGQRQSNQHEDGAVSALVNAVERPQA
jgi:acyl-CoA hydrolase/GNAT superfamily N-acetyltransferase